MPSTKSSKQPLDDYLARLYGPDPYDGVRRASEEHRLEHEASGAACGVYPSDPLKMRLLATLAQATGARRLFEIGCGLGYSALWLADAAGIGSHLTTIDRFSEHATLARKYAEEAGLSSRVEVLTGEADDLLKRLSDPYDFIHDDGWFAEEPRYFERMVALVRPRGLIAMSNWFLLDQAISRQTTMEWSRFAGPDWADKVKRYAERLAAHPGLHLSFIMRPAFVALAVKR